MWSSCLQCWIGVLNTSLFGNKKNEKPLLPEWKKNTTGHGILQHTTFLSKDRNMQHQQSLQKNYCLWTFFLKKELIFTNIDGGTCFIIVSSSVTSVCCQSENQNTGVLFGQIKQLIKQHLILILFWPQISCWKRHLCKKNKASFSPLCYIKGERFRLGTIQIMAPTIISVMSWTPPNSSPL